MIFLEKTDKIQVVRYCEQLNNTHPNNLANWLQISQNFSRLSIYVVMMTF